MAVIVQVKANMRRVRRPDATLDGILCVGAI